ncbi:hypothetical protein CCUS01_01879 [Colletotrichum cuscutae]|uniref:CorA-like transporter domain-containing protein n=1 Tax=Colletotrichum cuscutae TaxID=1209917 RepID=A0AAI9U6W7_9PEZI|nr:hypothetical protein CCUS01_01879 [Colletotrichum cuscutae]
MAWIEAISVSLLVGFGETGAASKARAPSVYALCAALNVFFIHDISFSYLALTRPSRSLAVAFYVPSCHDDDCHLFYDIVQRVWSISTEPSRRLIVTGRGCGSLQKGYYLPKAKFTATNNSEIFSAAVHQTLQPTIIRRYLIFSFRLARSRLMNSSLDATPFDSAIGPLEISAMMLFQLLSFYQVMLHFLNFLYVYASLHGDDKELLFSGFRTQKTLINPLAETKVQLFIINLILTLVHLLRKSSASSILRIMFI